MNLPRVLVAVGTDHHPFDRLMDWVSGWAGLPIDWYVQYGTSRRAIGIVGEPLLDTDELQTRMRDARAVACHGGPGLIMEARAAGHRPVVVARRPELGEHVDNHQVQFVDWLAARSDIRAVHDRGEFYDAVDAAVHDGPRLPHVSRRNPAVERLGRLVENLLEPR